MAVHAYHDGLAGFDPRNVLHDGCEECESRAAAGIDGVLALDGANRLQLWDDMLAYEWGTGVSIGRNPSRADHRVMRTLYLVAVLMEGFGVKPEEIETRGTAKHEADLARLAEILGEPR